MPHVEKFSVSSVDEVGTNFEVDVVDISGVFPVGYEDSCVVGLGFDLICFESQCDSRNKVSISHDSGGAFLSVFKIFIEEYGASFSREVSIFVVYSLKESNFWIAGEVYVFGAFCG